MISDSGINAAISAFIRHSELGSIKYVSKDNKISMEIIIKGYIEDKQKQQFIHKTYEALNLFYQLQQIKTDHLQIKFIAYADISIITLIRDDRSLCEEEIDLFVTLTEMEFSARLLNDENEAVSYQDMQQAVIDNIKYKIRPDQKVIAYRDQGKMFIFNQ